MMHLLVLFVQPVAAEIVITKIEVDQTPLPIRDGGFMNRDEDAPLRIPSTAKSLEFFFTQAGDESLRRLRYKLEVYDKVWRELHKAEGTKVSVQFSDKDSRIVGTQDFETDGETPGWRGTLEDSDFQSFKKEIIAPARTAGARLVVYGPTRNQGIGLIGFDDAKVTVVDAETGATRVRSLEITKGSDLDQPLGAPTEWDREGSGAGMAILRERFGTSPHPMLVVEDNDATNGALWAMNRNYRIQLQPADRMILEWKLAQSVGSAGPGVATYRNLAPGRYQFRIAAARANGELTGEEISLPFDVVPPFYQRSGFWIAAAALVLGTLIWFKRIFDQRLIQRRLEEIEHEQALEQERSRIARDLHDDIGAGLTAIAMESDLLKRELVTGATSMSLRRIENICGSAINLTRSVDEIVWAVNPANDTLDHFANYLSQATEEFLDAVGIRVRFVIPTDLPAVTLSGKMRHDLFLAIREALNNIAKHTRTEIVTLELRIEDQLLKIAIEDRGCGFSTDDIGTPGTHEGLLNMRRRMKDIGGECHITSQPGSGTRVEFILPLSAYQHHVTKN